MLHSKVIKSIAAIMLVMGIFTACKKDAFSEKDAIAAQTTLLQTKFSYDLAIKQIDLQIQRSGDSAKIVIQNLVNSGASALEILKQTNALAQILQNQTNLLAAYRYQDSLARNTVNLNEQLTKLRTLFNDSLAKALNNATLTAQLSKQYSVLVADQTTQQPIVGAVVSVLPVGTSTFATATTDATGTARFSSTLIIDPAAIFSISATNYGSALVQENNFVGTTSTSTVNVGGNIISVPAKTTTVFLYNATNTRNTIRGSILADLDLTNGDAVEGVNAQLVTFTQTTNNQLYQFPTLTDASGNFSVKVPDGTYRAVLPSTLRIQQKMFVNAWTDEDASSALPRIDSTGTVVQLNNFVSAAPGSARGYYLSFPADINGKAVFAAAGNIFPNSNNANFFIPQPYNYANNPTTPFPFINRAVGGNRSDSVSGNYFPDVNNLYLNNSNNQQSFDGQVRYRSRANTAAQPKDTVPVSLVSLVPGWITTPLQLTAVISGSNNNTGRIESVTLARMENSQFVQTSNPPGGTAPLGPTNHPVGVLGVNYAQNSAFTSFKAGAGGVFNQAAMFTASGRNAFNNLTGLVPATLYPSTANGNVGTNNITNFSVNSGNTYYLPIEYRSTISRDRTPR